MDKQKLREFSTTKPALQRMLKRLLSWGNAREEKDLQNEPQTIKRTSIGTYISIITLHIKGINTSTERHRLADGCKPRPIYILSARNPLQT